LAGLGAVANQVGMDVVKEVAAILGATACVGGVVLFNVTELKEEFLNNR